MRQSCAVVGALAVVVALASPASGEQKCPPEVAAAKALLTKSAAAKTPATARMQEVQAPRALAGSKSQEIQAPRSQEVQAPRAQEVQAPRAQEVQAPRAQEVQAPRAQEVQAPRSQEVQAPRAQEVQAPRSQEVQAPRSLTAARSLVREAEAACKKGDMALAKSKAEEAILLLK